MVTPTGETVPQDRLWHSATVSMFGDSVIIFGGTSLASNADLNDLFYLRKDGDSWSWSHPLGACTPAALRCAWTKSCAAALFSISSTGAHCSVQQEIQWLVG